MIFQLFKRISFLIVLFCFLTVQGFAVTFLGTAPKGVIELQGYKYPVSLYVPDSYDPEKIYPFLLALPDIGEGPAKHLEEWQSLAKKKNMIVLVPSLELRLTDTPFQTDQWLLQLKSEIGKQYRLDPEKIYLSGKKQGAHYAAYLGIRYPQEFAAVMLFESSWAGPLEKLMQWKGSTLKQRPFLTLIDEKDEKLIAETERVAYTLTQKGYPVYLKKVKKEELSSPELKKEAFEWAFDKQQAWAQKMAESRKTLKAKTAKVVEDFFKIPQQ